MIKIKAYSDEDLEELYVIFKETIYASCQNDYDLKQLDAWASIDIDHFEAILKKEEVYIAFDDAICGFISIDHDHIDLLYIKRDKQRNGVASKLLAHVYKRRKDRTLDVYASNTALPFFISQGFSYVRENKVIRKDVSLINHYLIKKVI